MAAEQVKWDREQLGQPLPASPRRRLMEINRRLLIATDHKADQLRAAAATRMIIHKMLPNRARRRVPRRHTVRTAGAASGGSDGGKGGASTGDGKDRAYSHMGAGT